MTVAYLLSFCIAFVLSFGTAKLAIRIARRYGILDDPKSAPDRKSHATPTPLLGGLALFMGIVGTLFLSLSYSPLLLDYFLSLRQLVGIALASVVLVVGGTLDDIKNFSPAKQILFPIVACVLAIFFGIGVPFISNPFGGVIALDLIRIPIANVSGVTYAVTLFADVFTFLWLMLLMYATKFLDGLDGLASGIGAIGSLLLFLFSIGSHINQPGTALVALIVAGACIGFWFLNRHPAKIFLGEGGSLLVGFFLGLMAVISGAKIATALLILAFPVLDVAWVVVSRISRGQKIWKADRSHLHFRLIDKGLTVNQVVSLFFALSLIFGASSLFVQTSLKLLFLCVALVLSGILIRLALGSTKSQSV